MTSVSQEFKFRALPNMIRELPPRAAHNGTRYNAEMFSTFYYHCRFWPSPRGSRSCPGNSAMSTSPPVQTCQNP
eukprot:3196461-Amphidinium_carterae.1